ncbi:MAG: cation:proton antiporter subunit C [Candidatus Brocadiae bacterium]|nr:cation:proton antiporter subunit C [Candidatus Brocadiia bacterium]
MNPNMLYVMAGIVVLCIGLEGILTSKVWIKKILGLNLLGTGVFLVLIAFGKRSGQECDPIMQSLVLTGIVISVSVTALALALLQKIVSFGSDSKEEKT